MDLTVISKTISHALRHEPWVYELELDSEGWVPISELIQALNEIQIKDSKINLSTIKEIIAKSNKPRFEINGDKIRAMYGHSISNKLIYTPAKPASVLYHGTSFSLSKTILNEGLKPMNRQYVHLSVNINMAKEVAKRKSKDIVILQIDSLKAYNEGVKFFVGNEYVWLCSEINPKYILTNL